MGPSEGTAVAAPALKRYIEDQQASNRTVYPSYDLEEKLEFWIMGQRYGNRIKSAARESLQYC